MEGRLRIFGVTIVDYGPKANPWECVTTTTKLFASWNDLEEYCGGLEDVDFDGHEIDIHTFEEDI